MRSMTKKIIRQEIWLDDTTMSEIAGDTSCSDDNEIINDEEEE